VYNFTHEHLWGKNRSNKWFIECNNRRRGYKEENKHQILKETKERINYEKIEIINKFKSINKKYIKTINDYSYFIEPLLNVVYPTFLRTEGYSGAYSSSSNGYGDKGYNKQDKDFECIINNNNTNTNIVGNGNQTEPLTCEECFTENLNQAQLNNLTLVLSGSRVGNLEGLCEQLLTNTTLTNTEKLVGLRALFANASITDVDAILRLLECLEELRLIIVPPNFDPILD
jgi:hypothetical protein